MIDLIFQNVQFVFQIAVGRFEGGRLMQECLGGLVVQGWKTVAKADTFEMILGPVQGQCSGGGSKGRQGMCCVSRWGGGHMAHETRQHVRE